MKSTANEAKDRKGGRGASPARLHFLDNLKTFIIFLVVLFHAAYAYSVYLSRDWYVVDTQHSLFFDAFILTAFAFMMPVMFFVAGYMGVGSLARKGQASFWRDKLLRIVAPWALGALFVAPAISYVYSASRGIYASYLHYWPHYFFSPDYQSHGQVHYYFLCVLTLYYVALWVAYRIYKPLGSVGAPKKPTLHFLALFGLATGIIFFCGNLFIDEGRWVKIAIFDLPATRFIPYLCYFFLGVLAYRRQWFTPSGYNPRLRNWALMCLPSFILFIHFFLKKLSSPGEVGMVCFAVSYFFFCLTAVFALIALFQKRLNFTTRFLTNLAAHSYGTYFIHYLVMVIIILALRDLHLNVFLKWLLAGALSATVSYLISKHLLSKTPFFGKAAKQMKPGPSYAREASAGLAPIGSSRSAD
jgi:peptidoglycan/LPS O-acetylase OafA/YrhL